MPIIFFYFFLFFFLDISPKFADNIVMLNETTNERVNEMANEKSRNLEIAETILAQLGGRMFTTMTGAKNLIAVENGLSFKIGRNCKGVSHVTVILNGRDLYDVTFLKCFGENVKTLAEVNDVYFDDLQNIFTEKTGLYTRL